MRLPALTTGLSLVLTACGGGGTAPTPVPPVPPVVSQTLDINNLVAGNGFLRVSGSASTGRFGVPIAGGWDCDGDGNPDFAMSGMQASPFGRVHAGTIHVLWGRGGAWPPLIDLAAGMRPDPASFPITDIYGAHGEQSVDDSGDTLMYSATAADIDGDGRADLIVNEMRGNGVSAAALDVGNLLIIGGARVPK